LYSLNMDETQAMADAFALAEEAAAAGDIPIGAVVVDREGRIIGRGRNRREEGDPLAHAEMLAIRQAAQAIGDWRLEGTTMVVTLEPCAMCAGALVNARVDRLVYAVPDPKAGAAGTLFDVPRDPRLNHRVEVASGVMAAECGELLSSFFRSRRGK